MKFFGWLFALTFGAIVVALVLAFGRTPGGAASARPPAVPSPPAAPPAPRPAAGYIIDTEEPPTTAARHARIWNACWTISQGLGLPAASVPLTYALARIETGAADFVPRAWGLWNVVADASWHGPVVERLDAGRTFRFRGYPDPESACEDHLRVILGEPEFARPLPGEPASAADALRAGDWYNYARLLGPGKGGYNETRFTSDVARTWRQLVAEGRAFLPAEGVA